MKNAAIGIVFNQPKTHVLLIKRRDIPIWVLPGGGIDEGETPEAAAVREVLEETGLQVTILRHVAEYEPINKLASRTFLYECQKIAGELSLSNETVDIRYFSLQALPPLFFVIHRDWLNDALKNSRDVIHSPLSQVTYWRLFLYFCRYPHWILRFLLTKIR